MHPSSSDLDPNGLATSVASEGSAHEQPEYDAVERQGRSLGLGARTRALIERFAILLLIILLSIVFSIMAPDTFPTLTNWQSLVLGQAVTLLLALAVLIPVVVGEFDLSVGYVLGFTAVVAAAVGGEFGLPGPIALLVALGAGFAVGLLNGLFVARFRINSLIATLGVGLAVSGLSVGVSGGTTLSTNIPDLFGSIAHTSIFGFGSAVWVALAVAFLVYFILAWTPLGRRMYATGGNERVARMIGVRTSALKIGAFGAAGLVAAMAGVVQLGLSGAANPSFGVNLLLPAFASVFLGSTTIKPGYFNVWGTVLAILLLSVGFSGLSLLGVPFWAEPVFDGAALIIGVLLSRSETRAVISGR